MNPDTQDPDAEIIVCRVTSWFFRRMGILSAMLLFMGLYFLYDGKFGYANDNKVAEKKVWFEKEYLKSFDEAKAAGSLDAWIEKNKAVGLPTGEDSEPPKWLSYAAQHGWPENPKKHSKEEINQQFQWGGAMLLLALVVIGKVLLDRGKKLTGYADRMVMPGGTLVRFADVFKVDKRKWDYKGLAYIHRSRESVAGTTEYSPKRKAICAVVSAGGIMIVIFAIVRLGTLESQLMRRLGKSDDLGILLLVAGILAALIGIYLFFAPTEDSEVVVVDDLKYEGAGRVLDRLLRHFKGELIEKVPEPEETAPRSPGDSVAAP